MTRIITEQEVWGWIYAQGGVDPDGILLEENLRGTCHFYNVLASEKKLPARIKEVVTAWNSGDHEEAARIASGDSDIVTALGYGIIPLPD